MTQQGSEFGRSGSRGNPQNCFEAPGRSRQKEVLGVVMDLHKVPGKPEKCSEIVTAQTGFVTCVAGMVLYLSLRLAQSTRAKFFDFRIAELHNGCYFGLGSLTQGGPTWAICLIGVRPGGL